MLSWDEVDNEDTGAAVIKGANARAFAAEVVQVLKDFEHERAA